jgi:hypothetical protein
VKIGANRRFAWLIAAALVGLIFAPSAASVQTPAQKHSRTVRITTQAPESNRWQLTTAANGTKRVFKCKTLACLAQEVVSFQFQKGSFTPPNAMALHTLATVNLQNKFRIALEHRNETAVNLFSAVTTFKNYPAALNETQISQEPNKAFLETATIFAGPAITTVESNLPKRELANNSLTRFIDAMTIVEVAGRPPPLAPKQPAPKLQNL